MFFDIIEDKVKIYEEEFVRLKYIGDDIIEFASFPLFEERLKITNKEKRQLQQIIERLETIIKTLEETRKLLKIEEPSIH